MCEKCVEYTYGIKPSQGAYSIEAYQQGRQDAIDEILEALNSDEAPQQSCGNCKMWDFSNSTLADWLEEKLKNE